MSIPQLSARSSRCMGSRLLSPLGGIWRKTAQPLASARCGTCLKSRHLSAGGDYLASNFGRWVPPRGFQEHEYGLLWYPTKAALQMSDPGPVLLGTSYEYNRFDSQATKQARKYTSFKSHEEFWQHISNHNKYERPQNLHEVFAADMPRCLYFDIDGRPEYRDLHAQVVIWLRHFVRWFFSGDRLGWSDAAPEPVILTSSDPSKYSCHVVFPQLQMRNFEEQHKYMNILLNALPALVVDLEGKRSVPILAELVDRVPYMQFQMFRGPYACKLAKGQLRAETRLVPEGYFRSDPLAYFASYVNPDYALELPSVEQLLDWNQEVRDLHMNQHRRIVSATQTGPWQVSPMDLANLYRPDFQQAGGGILDLTGMTGLEQYEEALQWLHEGRASQWWSWFRISGVTFRMLEQYHDNRAACDRIWRAHMAWSRSYSNFDEQENVEIVKAASGRRVSGMGFLLNLVRFDNPGCEVRSTIWQQQPALDQMDAVSN